MRDFLSRTFLGVERKRASTPPPIPDPRSSWTQAAWGTKSPYGGYSLDRGIRDGYELWEVVRACVDVIANHASSIPWRVSKFSDEEAKKWFEWEYKSVPKHELAEFTRNWKHTRGLSHTEKKTHELEPVPHHPLENLLEQPNGHMDRKFFIEIMVQHLLLAGNALSVKTRKLAQDGEGKVGLFGPPWELWPIYPDDRIEVVADPNRFIKEYLYKPDEKTEKIPYAPRDVVHAMMPNPINFRWGMPVLRSAIRTMAMDKDAAEWQRNMFDNIGVPPLGLTFDKDFTETKFDLTLRLLQKQFFGKQNARTPLVIGNAAKFQALGMSAVELDFIKSREINGRQVHSLFGVDPRITQFSQEAGNMAEIHRAHWVNRIVPMLERFQGIFTMYLTPEFPENIMPWFDTAGVDAFRDEFHKKVQTGKIMWSWGEPRDELNRRLNLGLRDHIEGGEHSYYPASAIRGDQLDAQAEAAIAAMKAVKEGHENADPNAYLYGVPDGSGNTNTPPDGGDPGQSGNQSDDSKKPDDDNPEASNDGQQGKKDVTLSTRWIKEHAELWLAENGFEVLDYDSTDNFHVFQCEATEAKGGDIPEGVEMNMNSDFETRSLYVSVSFYHGEVDDRVEKLRREREMRWARARVPYGENSR